MRFFLEVKYQGTHYHGWQKQPNAISVQEVIEEKLSMLFRRKVEIVASGRTDTGVHCLQQFIHFDLDNDEMISNLVHRLNIVLPSAIAVGELWEVLPDAHTRFDAKERSYVYHIHRNKTPFLEKRSFQFHKPLDLALMGQACEILKKYNDFTAFSKTNSDVKTHICDIKDAFWSNRDEKLEFHITANRFLRGMVRLIVGGMLDVGVNKLSLDFFEKALASKQRGAFRNVAPAEGLYLNKVAYPESLFIKSIQPA